MKWVLTVLAINTLTGQKQWTTVPGWTSKAQCEVAAKQFGMFGAGCFPDANTLPHPPKETQ